MGWIVGIIDRLTEGMKREDTFTVFLETGDFGSADTSFGHSLATLGPGMPDTLDGLLLHDTVGTALLELMGDVLGDKPGIEIRVLNFDDGDFDVLGVFLQPLDKVLLNRVDLSRIGPDDKSRLGSENRDLDAVLNPFDIDVAKTGLDTV